MPQGICMHTANPPSSLPRSRSHNPAEVTQSVKAEAASPHHPRVPPLPPPPPWRRGRPGSLRAALRPPCPAARRDASPARRTSPLPWRRSARTAHVRVTRKYHGGGVADIAHQTVCAGWGRVEAGERDLQHLTFPCCHDAPAV